MKQLILVAVGMSMALMFKSNAATIDFDDLADGTHVTSQYTGVGVTFSTGWINPSTSTPDPIAHPGYAGFLGLNGVVFDSYCNAPEFVQASFTVPVNFVSIQIQPFEGGTFTYGLQVFDGSGQLIDGAELTRVSGSSWDGINTADLVTLELTATGGNIASARFYGYNEYGNNAVSFDNLTFNGVPEASATLGLLGLAVAVLAGMRRKLCC